MPSRRVGARYRHRASLNLLLSLEASRNLPHRLSMRSIWTWTIRIRRAAQGGRESSAARPPLWMV